MPSPIGSDQLANRSYPSVSSIEKAYVRGLREGERRGRARYQKMNAAFNEVVIRLKTAKGELRRRALAKGK